jgi:hypothetical protein
MEARHRLDGLRFDEHLPGHEAFKPAATTFRAMRSTVGVLKRSRGMSPRTFTKQ